MRLADVRPVEDLDLHEEYVELDITDLEAFTAACGGIDTVLHLAASGLLPELVVTEYHRGIQRLRSGASSLPAASCRIGLSGCRSRFLGCARFSAECLRCHKVFWRGPRPSLRRPAWPVLHQPARYGAALCPLQRCNSGNRFPHFPHHKIKYGLQPKTRCKEHS